MGERSETQWLGHAREIASAWQVDTRPRPLSLDGEPPPGPVVAHYQDVRRPRPHRLSEIRFVTIRPDPALIATLPPRGRGVTVDFCEFDEAKILHIAADLSVLFPSDRFRWRRGSSARQVISCARRAGGRYSSPLVCAVR